MCHGATFHIGWHAGEGRRGKHVPERVRVHSCPVISTVMSGGWLSPYGRAIMVGVRAGVAGDGASGINAVPAVPDFQRKYASKPKSLPRNERRCRNCWNPARAKISRPKAVRYRPTDAPRSRTNSPMPAMSSGPPN